MPRKTAHCEEKEPFLESVLSTLRFKKIIQHILPNSKILDLGCGYNAGFLKTLNKKNCECVGLDISVNQECKIDDIILIEHDLNLALPFKSDTFDVVSSLANLEHLQDPEEVLNEICRVLKPGGMLLLTTPSVYAKPVLEFLSYNLHLISENEIRDHKNYFNKQSLLELCKKAGFSKTNHGYFQFFMNNFVIAIKKN